VERVAVVERLVVESDPRQARHAPVRMLMSLTHTTRRAAALSTSDAEDLVVSLAAAAPAAGGVDQVGLEEKVCRRPRDGRCF
jgi:hypothetical protein